MKLLVMRNVILTLVAASSACLANSLTLIPSSGLIDGPPGQTVGWGYTLENTTGSWLVPLGLSINSPAQGTVVDIFDYPTVAPDSTVTLDYLYFSPGGAGNSVGLMEYTIPLSLSPGATESGSVVLQYQLFDSNPDTNPAAMPIGAPSSLPSLAYEVDVSAASSVPEPSYTVLLVIALGIIAMAEHLRTRRREPPSA
jgi:hypothetical protein